MKNARLVIAALAALLPSTSWACDGGAGAAIAISTDGHAYTVTNTGRQAVQVVFGAWGKTYELDLAPGQSGTPATSGTSQLPMSGYQTCYATVTAPPAPRRR